MTHYLGPVEPRWEPSTEDDLTAALDGGLLEETHWVELKEKLDTGKGANKELARDLASFAIHGGTLIVGVAELQSRLVLSPQPLSGLPERVEQVAHTVPDPPLHVRCHPIQKDSGELGYLIISIPPSPHAPHMVDGRYIGRGDKTKRVLPDPEVRALHAQLRASENEVYELLDWHINRDPIPNADHAHLYIVAQPQPGRPDLLRDVVSGSGWQQRLLVLRNAALQPELLQPCGLQPIPPNLAEADFQRHRQDGKALTNSGLEDGREPSKPQRRSGNIIELEVSESGQLRMYCSRLSDQVSQDGKTHALLDELAVLLVRQLIAVVVAASEQIGYLGTWGFGVAGTGMRGMHSAVWLGNMWDGPPYTEDGFKRVTIATYGDLTQSPGMVADALVGHLTRALGTEHRFTKALQGD